MVMKTSMFWPLLIATVVSTYAQSKPHGQVVSDHKFPATRHLAELAEKGNVEDGIVVEFASNSIKQHDDSEEVAERAQTLLKELDGICTSAKPTFRKAGKHNDDHIAFGLQYFYDFECPAPPSTTATTSNNTEKNAFEKLFVPSKGQNAVAAMHKLRDIMLNEDKMHTEKSNNNSSIQYLNIKEAAARQKIENKEYLGEVAPEPIITEHDHPELWARQKQNEEKQSLRRLNEENSPKDKYYSIGYQSHYSAIDLQGAWDYLADRDAWRQSWKVVVHVLDSGWQLSHEDAGVNKWRNRKEICGNGIDDDGNGFVDDCFGYNHADDKGNNNILGSGDHGSHVSGTIAANTDNNGKGVAGVAGGGSKGTATKARGVSIMTGVGFGKQNTGGFAESIVYAADNGAKISSNSWGFTDPDYEDPAVRAAILYATNKGVLMIFAAGNDNSDRKYYPAAMDQVISVSATYNNGVRASFTNYGATVDIAAPGMNVLSTSLDGMYKFKSGTSMACPHVAGVVAMGKSLFRREAKRADLKACLLSTAQDIGDPSLGAGMVNPVGFLECLDQRFPARARALKDNDTQSDSDGKASSTEKNVVVPANTETRKETRYLRSSTS